MAITRGDSCRRGSVFGTVAVSLLGMLAMAGFAIDMAIVVLACQRCQVAADAGVLAGSQELRTPYLALYIGRAYAAHNTPADTAADYAIDAEYYAPGSTVPGVGTAEGEGVLRVTVSKRVPYLFLRVLGLQETTVTRSAYSTKVVTGTCIAPMWIWHTTPVSYGVQINLLMADAPNCGIPGSFGFLEPAGGVDFQLLLKGLVSLADEEKQRVHVGDTVWAKTGLAVDHWRGPLETDSDSRIKRAQNPPWATDTFLNFRADNPRILIVPMVEYIGGTGSGAYFTIRRFAAFWLEDVITNGSDRYIQGRFIDFAKPGGTRYGLKPTHLIR